MPNHSNRWLEGHKHLSLRMQKKLLMLTCLNRREVLGKRLGLKRSELRHPHCQKQQIQRSPQMQLMLIHFHCWEEVERCLRLSRLL